MKRPDPKLVATLRLRRQEIEAEADLEFSFVSDLVAAEVGLLARHPEHRRALRTTWRRHALALPPDWLQSFVRGCRTNAVQNAPLFDADSPTVVGSLADLKPLARLLVGARRRIAANTRSEVLS